MCSYGPPHIAGQKQDNQHEHIFSSYERIRDVALKTWQRRWTIGKSGERGTGISFLVIRHDDIYIYIYIYMSVRNFRYIFSNTHTHWQHLCWRIKLPQWVFWTYTKQSDGEASVMLELWEMQCTILLPLLPGALWPAVVAPDRFLSVVQTELSGI